MSDSVMLAAQADLVMLTVEMLRLPTPRETMSLVADLDWHSETPTPEVTASSPQAELWFDLPTNQLDELLDAGLGEASVLSLDTESKLTPRIALADVQRCAAEFDIASWRDECVRLFDGAMACPLNQASYIRRDKGKILGDVSGFYNAFGWRAGLDTGERPDHLLCQLEFVGMLLALASRAPDLDSKEIVTEALSKFAREHMHDWIPAVCWQMCDESQCEYFGAVSQWLLVLWQTLTSIHHWPVDVLPNERLKPIVDPDSPYECGAPDLHQIQTG
ncbi:MAG: molecular chaperone TorD family protein [Aureliella sp.]